MTRLWNDRLMWSGEIPLDYPDLNPVAALRFDNADLASGTWPDAVNPARTWSVSPWSGSPNAVVYMDWDNALRINSNNPVADAGRLTLPYFTGLWPSTGKLLVSLWMRQNYTMLHNPLMTSRDGPGTPLMHLATTSAAAFRHQVYSESGSLLFDQFESHGWGHPTGWVWMAQLIDFDAHTTQLVAVDRGTNRKFLGPQRSFTGDPNPSATANLQVFGLANGDWYAGGFTDEVFVSHPGENFSLPDLVERIRTSSWADAQDESIAGSFVISDSSLEATETETFHTGAEAVTWDRTPNLLDLPSGSTWFISTDGSNWTSPTSLPETFTGWMRWEIPLLAFEQFTGIDLIVPATAPPTLQPIPDVTLQQNAVENRTLNYTITGPATWSVQSTGLTDIQRVGNQLVISSGWQLGTEVVTVTITDEYLQSASRVFAVEVTPADAPPPDVPIYPRAPIILHNDDGIPEEVLTYPLRGVILKETNGEDTFTFEVFANDPQNKWIKHEEFVTCAGETYRIRRITDIHSGSQLVKTVYCEAKFYDLATKKQIDGREWEQTTAGEAMQFALAGTGWSVSVANVSTLRTYEHEDTNPLEFLRFIRQHHGGELVFDNQNQTVSLLTSTGRDSGVSFFYGYGLSEAKRVVDTTSLVTRIYAKNEEGVTIAPVNNGVPYVEDFTFTNEIKTATYDFKSGTNPYTMLSMAQATLADRSRPDVSYEVTVDDLSRESGREIDRFNIRDYVRVVDESIDMNVLQRIVGIEYDVIRPWNSVLTLSSRLRELGSDTDVVDEGTLSHGAGLSYFELVPYNLLLNGRFDTAFAHWARFGAVIERTEQGTSDYSAVFRGSGDRWIEQTVQPDNRNSYALSLDVESSGGPQGWVPNLVVSAVVTYEDGSEETIEIQLV